MVTVRLLELARPASKPTMSDFSVVAVSLGFSSRLREAVSRLHLTVAAECRAQATWNRPTRRVMKTGETRANSSAVAPEVSRQLRLRRMSGALADTQRAALGERLGVHHSGVGAGGREVDVGVRQEVARAERRAGDRRRTALA